MPLIKPSMNKEKLDENVCVFSHTSFSDLNTTNSHTGCSPRVSLNELMLLNEASIDFTYN